jgi:NitT/TauT family transport system substrate-binding protein
VPSLPTGTVTFLFTDNPVVRILLLHGQRENGARPEIPAATKWALRAILKADQLCTLEPERSARKLVDKGFARRYDYAVQTLKEVRYDTWRDYDPEATLRFHSLRMREIGVIKSIPQKIIAQGTDWRFLNELKKELKA